MHLSHVGIYLTAFLTPTDASLIVRESSGTCLTLSLSPSKHSLMGTPRAPRGEGAMAALQDSGTTPSLILTWLARRLHATALNSAWADLSQGEGNQISLRNTSSLRHEHALQGVAARWVCPALPWEALPSAIPVGTCAEQWEKRRTARAWTSPGMQGQGWCGITARPSVAMQESVKDWVDVGKQPQRNRISPGIAPRWAQDYLGLLQTPLELHEHAAERRSVVWVIPLGRMSNAVLSRAELCVFAVENLFGVSVLHFQEVCALCKQRGWVRHRRSWCACESTGPINGYIFNSLLGVIFSLLGQTIFWLLPSPNQTAGY